MSLPIGFFSPLPLPIMVPFMFMQSAAMALGFGSFFQYGKRKLSAMSNEEFNALTPEALTAQLMSSINNMIPTVEQSFKQMEQMNVMILEAMAKYFDQAVGFLNEWIKGGAAGLVHNIEHGTEDITTSLTDAFEFTGKDIPDFIPTAGADLLPDTTTTTTTKALTPNEKWASKYFSSSSGSLQGTWDILSLKGITKAELGYLIDIYLKGSLPKVVGKWGSAFEGKWKKLGGTPLTIKEIEDKTLKAIPKDTEATVKTIAQQWASLQSALAKYMKTKSNHHKNKFQIAAKLFNQFVAANGQPKLQINSEKSLKSGTLIPK